MKIFKGNVFLDVLNVLTILSLPKNFQQIQNNTYISRRDKYQIQIDLFCFNIWTQRNQIVIK